MLNQGTKSAMEINDNEFINSSHENWVKVKDEKKEFLLEIMLCYENNFNLCVYRAWNEFSRLQLIKSGKLIELLGS